MEVYGWGRFPRTSAEILEPTDAAALPGLISSKRSSGSLIPRGAGRSYGDAALAGTLLSSRFLDSFQSLDSAAGTIRCGAGVSLDDILKVAIPHGWFLPVLPGTKFVSLGGAIAADIHGKNHHRDGSFSESLLSLSLLLASGETVCCSKTENAELFNATIGGMGLTGIIADATIACLKISSVDINQRSLVANNLEQAIEILEQNQDSHYSVAWLDCLARGEQMGRSIIYLGEHCEDGSKVEHETTSASLTHKTGRMVSVPFTTPGFLLNRFSMSLFNGGYYALQKKARRDSRINYDKYFFPLDSIGNWNRLYGGNGFLQYQFVIPSSAALEGISQVLNKVADSGKGSFLSVLKKLGPQNQGLLSFPIEGYTLTLDFKRQQSLFPLLEQLDEIVLAHGGRHYLAKDAHMSEKTFKASYPNWEQFAELKSKIDPDGIFASQQSKRLGLS